MKHSWVNDTIGEEFEREKHVFIYDEFLFLCFVQVSMQHSEGISANTEFEYLKNIMFQVKNFFRVQMERI